MPPRFFNRPPRVRASLPSGTYRIPTPPPPPSDPPKLNALVLALSLVGGLISSSVILIYFMSGSTQSGSTSGHSGSTMILLIMVSMFVASGLGTVTTVVQHRSQKADFLKSSGEQEAKFKKALEACRGDITKAIEEQRRLMLEVDPAPAVLVQRAVNTDRRLWERRPTDDDFLCLRLGIGQAKPSFTVAEPMMEYSADGPLASAVRALASEASSIQAAPTHLDLKALGSVGIVGSAEQRLSLTRALVAGLCIQHAPDEVRLLAVCHPGRVAAWEWLKWLPHVDALNQTREKRSLAFDPGSSSLLIDGVVEEFRRRRAQLRDDARRHESQTLALLLDDLTQLTSHPGLGAVIADGASVRVLIVLLADSVLKLPGSCGAIAEFQSDGTLSFQRAGVAQAATLCAPDGATVAECEQFARSLASISFQTQRPTGELPPDIRLLDLLGEQAGGALKVEEWWKGKLLPSARDRLQVPLGVTQDGRPLVFAPLEHGPHGLVAGTTGSGKSELLRSMVSALALTHHPHEVAFVLIDFKGGSAFADLRDLPHTVGMVTNLSKSMVLRAINALRSELERRMRLFQQAGVQDIRAYQRLQREVPLPALLVVIDEYAELHDQYGDLLDEFIRIARVGRTLGVWLILATQRPAGKVKDDMSANMGYRMCLRVQTPEESRDVLRGRSEAASLPVVPRGRMFYQVGDNEIFEMLQVAHVAGSSREGGAAATQSFTISEILPDGLRRPLLARQEDSSTQHTTKKARQRRDVEAIVDLVRQTADKLQVTRLPGLWPDVLPAEPLLSELLDREDFVCCAESGQSTFRNWLTAPIGILDEIELQRLSPLHLDLQVNGGHFLVTGAPQTGLEQFLRTVVYSLSYLHTPGDLWIYLLDFGGGDLKPLDALPTVGDYLRQVDEEKVHRLCTMLDDELDRRRNLFLKCSVDSLEMLRERYPDDAPAAMLLLLHNYFAFRQAYENHMELLLRLAREGGPLGLHLMVSASRPTDVQTSLFTLIGNRLSFRLTDVQDYDYILGRKPAASEEALPVGRGWWAQPFHEFQVASVVAKADAGDLEGLRGLCRKLSDSWSGTRPPAVRVLPSTVALADVLDFAAVPEATSAAEGRSAPLDREVLAACVALESTHLKPFDIEIGPDHPHWFIAGPAASGKTTALKNMILALASRYPPTRWQCVVLGLRKNPLQDLGGLPHVVLCRFGLDSLSDVCDVVRVQLEERLAGKQDKGSRLIVALDDTGMLLRRADASSSQGLGDAITLLNRVAVEGGDLGLHLVLAGSIDEMNSAHQDFVRLPRVDKSGFLLRTHERFDLPMFGVRLPEGAIRPELPPGRAYTYRDGHLLLVQIASPDVASATSEAPATTRDWVGTACSRWSGQPHNG